MRPCNFMLLYVMAFQLVIIGYGDRFVATTQQTAVTMVHSAADCLVVCQSANTGFVDRIIS